ncbi:hypothetical protein ACGF5O_29545 [Streptomyces sp. NPDC048291]|uniref:hypothetical protein n=1 Tax=Streptomyces sp. NPDC048291 TaxID=3365530 RepID=UPI00371D893D
MPAWADAGEPVAAGFGERIEGRVAVVDDGHVPIEVFHHVGGQVDFLADGLITAGVPVGHHGRVEDHETRMRPVVAEAELGRRGGERRVRD